MKANVMKSGSYFKVCKELIYADLCVFKQTCLDKVIDVTIWVVLTLGVNSYIMPYFGLSNEFGVFQLGGVIAATGLFELYASVIELVSDFEGNREINFSLTLPIPSWLALLSKAIYFFLIYTFISLLMIPVGKLTLWNQFDLRHIDYPKFILCILFQNIFYACFVLWVASIIANISKVGSVWSRCIFPMWFMGGFQFSWAALKHVVPIVAYINLLNPMIYITEAMRVALLGQADYINFWICIGAISFFSLICFVVAMRNLRRRLDFV